MIHNSSLLSTQLKYVCRLLARRKDSGGGVNDDNSGDFLIVLMAGRDLPMCYGTCIGTVREHSEFGYKFGLSIIFSFFFINIPAHWVCQVSVLHLHALPLSGSQGHDAI